MSITHFADPNLPTLMKATLKQWANKQLRYSPYFYRKLKDVQQERTLSAAETEHIRNERFVTLIRKAYRHSSFYQNLYDQAGVNLQQVQVVEDITRLPPITKQDVKKHIDQIFIGQKFNRIRSFTSGTSGPPLRVYRDYRSMVYEWAYQWRQRITFGHHPGRKTIVLRGNLHRNQQEYYDPFTNTLYLSSYHFNEQQAAWYYDKIAQFAPQAIYAYPSSMESLVNLFGGLGKSVFVPLVFTSSETLYHHQRTKIEARFETRVVDWYGNSERTIALEQSPDGWYDEIPLYSINEYLEDHILTTGLTNASFPLIRYRVDDVIHLDKHNRIKPSGYRRVKEIQGRNDDILLLPDGSRIGMICGIFDSVPKLQRAQVVQDQPHTFQVNIVVEPEFGKEEELFLREKITEFLGYTPYSLSYVSEDQIIRAKSGKYKLIVNRLLSKVPSPGDTVATQ